MKCQAFVCHNFEIRYNGVVMNNRDEWYEYINQKYYDWRGDTRKTISEFAEWLNFSQGQLSQYMRKDGRIPTGQTVINRFARRFGVEIYEVLGIPVPDDSMLLLPEPMRTIAREIRDTLAAKYIPEDAPEAGEVVDEILKKHGYNLTTISDDPSE